RDQFRAFIGTGATGEKSGEAHLWQDTPSSQDFLAKLVACTRKRFTYLCCYSPGHFRNKLPRVFICRSRFFTTNSVSRNFVAAVALLGHSSLHKHCTARLYRAVPDGLFSSLSIT